MIKLTRKHTKYILKLKNQKPLDLWPNIQGLQYCMSEKACLVFLACSLYTNGQDLLDTRYKNGPQIHHNKAAPFALIILGLERVCKHF